MTQQEQYQFQQIVMASLGLYEGKCEGAWGPKSIAAKREWELTADFEPAVPTGGRPFVQGCKLPKGMRWVPGTDKMLVSFITEDEFAKLYKAHALLTVKDIENPVPATEPTVAAVEPTAILDTPV
jgi:hypothetical protein